MKAREAEKACDSLRDLFRELAVRKNCGKLELAWGLRPGSAEPRIIVGSVQPLDDLSRREIVNRVEDAIGRRIGPADIVYEPSGPRCS